jgi:hypothetical protein
MGLDMYLAKKHYVQNWDHMRPEERYSVSVRQGGKRLRTIKPERISYVVEQVAYWRKANQIHKWFVDNVQGGNDDCREYYVEREKLKELLATVSTVLQGSKLVAGKITNGYTLTSTGTEVVRNPNIEDGQRIADPSVANALLPTQEGFFFGGNEYDQYYYEDLEYTRETLAKVLEEPDDGSFYYDSSW